MLVGRSWPLATHATGDDRADHPQATRCPNRPGCPRIDLAAHYAYLGERNLGIAQRFLLNAQATFATLARSPGLGMGYPSNDPRLTGLRCSRIKRFKNHLIFYLPMENGIEVIRVIHAARDIPTALADD